MTPEELTAYYEALLILQYVLKPNASGTIGALVAELVADMIENQVRDGFDLDTAVGKQLDYLGEYRGVDRTVFGLVLTKDYFQLPSTDVVDPSIFFGFARVADPGIPSWFFLRIADVTAMETIMNDGQFSLIIKYLARVQAAFLSLEEIDSILDEFFGQYVIMTDNEDMTITYTHDSADPGTLFDFVDQLNLLPKPAGVLVNVVTV